jgi:predicted Rossmann-fold nucleotide-binding protein
MTWAQLGHHRKPIVFGNINGFWNPMLALMDHMAQAGFIHTARRVQPLVIDQPEAIVPAILTAATTNGTSAEGDEAVLDKL